ncbi:hypothetical protein C0585_07960 [Candidatus Woesearchaeota archaeon]|nr:MAG: hypothetical protein C0585_07960 [Candidatus Woesearchaeota archaeon]
MKYRLIIYQDIENREEKYKILKKAKYETFPTKDFSDGYHLPGSEKSIRKMISFLKSQKKENNLDITQLGCETIDEAIEIFEEKKENHINIGEVVTII